MRLEETEELEDRDKKTIRDQLETQVLNLKAELDNERHSKRDFSNNLKKAERRIKEWEVQQEQLIKKLEHLQVYQ